MSNLLYLLQATSGSSSTWQTVILFGGMFVVMYFFMIRPQQKKQKEAKLFRESLKKGDAVVTIGGLHGKISSIEDNGTVVIEVDKGVKLTFQSESISAESTKKVSTTATTKA